MNDLSSSLTFFYKFVLPLLWFIGFAVGGRDLLFDPQAYDERWLQYMALWLGVTLSIVVVTGGIKKVWIEGDVLRVSNYRQSVHIDVNQIEEVDGSVFLSPRLVWLKTNSATPFGRKIIFLPRRRLTKGVGKHPLVVELRREWGLGQGRQEKTT